MRLHLVALYRNLVAGTRLALFLPVRPYDYRAAPLDYALLIVFNFIVWVTTAWIRSGFAGDFDEMAIPIYLGAIPLVLVTAMLVAWIYDDGRRLVLIATGFTASYPAWELISLVVLVVATYAGFPSADFLVLAWLWVIALRAVIVCGGVTRPQVLKAALAVTAMLAIGYFAFPRTDVWIEPEEQEEAAPLAEERLFHLQGRLIERALAAIAPGRSGRHELYFVGFAPDASEEVFLHEMRFVRDEFDERFGTAGHSIALVSSQDALEEFPIASGTNLSRALARVGEQMNADEDTLFLFLSAHGYQDHRLSAVQPPLELSPLTPTALGRMLQDSGIKWRVIVVSACYSGGFIEPLRDDNTIVITASSAERSSFGCESGRDFTYFGEAYFRDALARTTSFTKAFELARSIVAEREAKEKLEPSLPQMWVGRAIGERLKNAADQPDKE